MAPSVDEKIPAIVKYKHLLAFSLELSHAASFRLLSIAISSAKQDSPLSPALQRTQRMIHKSLREVQVHCS